MRVTYVFDAYCGWCYGFAPAVAELATEDWVDLRVISGSLFPRHAGAPIGAYPHIPAANARIAELTGAAFGSGYLALLAEGRFVMDSDAAAVGLVALKRAGGNDLRMAHAMQAAFYRYGHDLGKDATYVEIARRHGLELETVLDLLHQPETHRLAAGEQEEVRALGVAAYPTLLAHTESGTYRLGGPATSGERLKQLARAARGARP